LDFEGSHFMASRRVVVCYPVEDRHLSQIKAACGDAEIVNAGQERIADELTSADWFLGHAKVPVPWSEVVRRGRLKWIQSSAAGLDHCLTHEVIASDIEVTSASGLFADQVAEQTLALLLGLLRGIPTFFRQQQRKEFVRRPTDDLHGATVGIVGFGGNGRRIAQVLAPFGVRVLATDWWEGHAKPCDVEAIWPAARLPDLLPLADVLILSMPLNAHTEGMFGDREFALMKPGCVLINVARGQVVREKALVAALRSGQIAAAGLDVTEIEPLPAASPLWDMPNVLITPHVGAQSARRVDDTTDLICENIERKLRGQPLLNRVDKRLGFPERTAVPWIPSRRRPSGPTA
jgi:phosphoglycerate dehydrogenase-like enzyme